LTSRVATTEEQQNSRKVREAMSVFRQSEDLIQLGAYVSGSNPMLDAAIRVKPQLNEFLRQGSHEVSSIDETRVRLATLAEALK
jgi:flagellum-specific ATP synthase